VYLTGRVPVYVPELLSIQYINTNNNWHHNIFIEDGLVVFVTAYYKGFYASNDVKIIYQYLPREVGELVVWYLWLVLLFVCQLAVIWRQVIFSSTSQGSNTSKLTMYHSLYLWGPDIGMGCEWSSKCLRKVLK
jgi:hypothetical protein